MTGTREDAEDCVQDAIVAALLAAPGAIVSVPAWIETVSHRRAVDVVRRRAATARAAAHVMHRAAAVVVDPAEEVADRDAAAWIDRHLDELPAATAAVVRELATGASRSEVATRLGLSYRSVESHVTRARKWASNRLRR